MRISFFVQRRRVKRERAPPIVAEGSPVGGRCGEACRIGRGEPVNGREVVCFVVKDWGVGRSM